MSAQEWIEKRASELATIHEKEMHAAGRTPVIEWNKFFFIATAQYFDACGLKPKE